MEISGSSAKDKDKDVNLTLYNNRIVIRQRVSKRQTLSEAENSDFNTIVFVARIDTLQRISLC